MIYDDYLLILSKILSEQSMVTDEMNNLYHLVDEELYSTLEEVYFPSMPELSKRFDQLFLSIKSLLICPELIGKEVIVLQSHYTNFAFESIKFEIGKWDYKWLIKNQTQIPIVVVNDEKFSIEVISESFAKASISKDEYEILLRESNKCHVAINRLIKFFIIRVPIYSKDKCYILDNTYRTASRYFETVICTNILKVTGNDIKYLNRTSFNEMDFLLCEKSVYDGLINNGIINEGLFKHVEELSLESELFKGKAAIVSFYDELKYSICMLTKFYNKNIVELELQSDEITCDLVRDDNKRISKVGNEIKIKLNSYREAKCKIDEVIFKLQKAITNIDKAMYKCNTHGATFMNKKLKNKMFEYYFSVAGIDSKEESACIKRILDYGYEHKELLLNYSKSVNSGKKINECTVTNDNSWECAKMMIYFIDSNESKQNIKELLYQLGKERLETGKEWYYWARINKDKNALKTAVQLDYNMACDKMFDEQGDDPSVLRLLSSVLYPSACVAQGISDTTFGDKKIISVDDKRLAYLKIAAAIGDKRGMEAISDILYDNVVWAYFSTKGVPLKGKNIDTNFLEVCNTLQSLCSYLIEIKNQVQKNKERCAVINFCLNRNMSEVHSTFYNKGSAAAYLCKGYLNEYGICCSKNLDKALSAYDKVDGGEIPAVKNAKRRVKSKITTRERAKSEEYDEDEDYSGYSSSSIVDSGYCFITTAACCALNKGRDCDELNYLRKFRDEHIKGTDEGDALVNEYYNIAPKLIEIINREENASDIYANLWTNYIVPSTEKILQGKWQEAQDIYVAMVVDLSNKYKVDINIEGYENLYHSTLKRIGYES